MEIGVFGAGSLGSALGGMLATKHDVTLVGRRAHIAAVRKHGLRLTGDIDRRVHVAACELVAGLSPPGLLIISVKAYDTPQAIKACSNWADENTLVVTFQNGLGNLELLREWKGLKAFGGTTTMGAKLLSPGAVRISGLGQTIVGSDLDARGAQSIASALRACGMKVSVKSDIFREIWTKAVISACINPTAAVLRVPNGGLLESRAISRLMREISQECESVAEVSQIRLPGTHIFPLVRRVCKDTANNVSSMLQDVQRGRRTEIGQINRVFSSTGKIKGIPTPLNDTLVAMIESLDASPREEKG